MEMIQMHHHHHRKQNKTSRKLHPGNKKRAQPQMFTSHLAVTYFFLNKNTKETKVFTSHFAVTYISMNQLFNYLILSVLEIQLVRRWNWGRKRKGFFIKSRNKIGRNLTCNGGIESFAIDVYICTK